MRVVSSKKGEHRSVADKIVISKSHSSLHHLTTLFLSVFILHITTCKRVAAVRKASTTKGGWVAKEEALKKKSRTIVNIKSICCWRGGGTTETIHREQESVTDSHTTNYQTVDDKTLILEKEGTAIMSESKSVVIRAIFSDVDGTLAHYPEDLSTYSNDDLYVKFPPSTTGMRGVISRQTLKLCQQIRDTNIFDTDKSSPSSFSTDSKVKFVLVSGMRTTTLLQRLPYLPLADAYCSENGGRIFYPVPLSSHEVALQTSRRTKKPNEFYPPSIEEGCNKEGASLSTMYRLQEDMEWRQYMSSNDAAGSDGYHNKSPALTKPIDSRRGVLWEFASDLMRRGWTLDHRGYATGFRIHMKKQTTPNLDPAYLKKNAPSTLSVTENLGSYDIYPSKCGKKNVCEYLAKKLCGVTDMSQSCVCFCDDDNDIAMATSCRYAFLPSLTSDSMRRQVEESKQNLLLATSFDPTVTLETTDATDVIVRAALDLCQTGVLVQHETSNQHSKL